MKRPFAAIGFTGFAALLVLFICQSSRVALFALFIFATAGIISLLNKKLRQVMTLTVGLFTVAAACLLFILAAADVSSAQSLAGDNVKIEAVVSQSPYLKTDNGRHYCILSLKSIDGKRARGRLRLSFSPSKDGIDPESLEIGAGICFRGKAYIPGSGEKSISRYFAGENIVLGAYGARDVRVEAPRFKGVAYTFSQIRKYVSDTLRYGLGDKTAGLIVGILTGDKSLLDDRIYESFKKTGIAHLMAVSGLHLSLWIFYLGALIPENGRASRLRYILLALAVVFIMLLAGMSESVKRAGFMSLVYLSGKLSKRRSDSLNSLGFAVTVMLLLKPSCVLSISMQLSFLSTLGILTLGERFIGLSAEIFGGKKINTYVKRLMRYCADIFFISISVLVFTFPVLIYSFGGISTVSAWVNILVSPVVAPLLLMSGAYVLFSSAAFISFPLASVIRLLSYYVVACAHIFLRAKNAFLIFSPENLLLFAAGGAIVIYLCFIAYKRKYRTFKTAFICLFTAAVFITAGNLCHRSNQALHLAFYDGVIATAVEKDGQAVLLNSVPQYEKGLFSDLLEEKGARLLYEAELRGKPVFKSTLDGKYISLDDKADMIVGLSAEQVRLRLCEKDIHIFYSEALQCDCNCDIIINILDNGIIIGAEGKSLSLNSDKSITLKLSENKMILRGENPWLNLMKSS